MTFQSNLRKLAEGVRAIAADYGVRTYSLAVRVTTYSGSTTDQPIDGTGAVVSTPITEGGNNPRITFRQSTEIATNDFAIEIAEVGPITPDYPGGGTALSTLVPDLTGDQYVHYIITGPRYPGGQLFELDSLEHSRGYQYRLILRRSL